MDDKEKLEALIKQHWADYAVLSGKRTELLADMNEKLRSLSQYGVILKKIELEVNSIEMAILKEDDLSDAVERFKKRRATFGSGEK